MTAQLTSHNSPCRRKHCVKGAGDGCAPLGLPQEHQPLDPTCSLVVGGHHQQQDQCSTEEPAGGRGHIAWLRCGWSLERRRELAGGTEAQSGALRSRELLLCMVAGKARGPGKFPELRVPASGRKIAPRPRAEWVGDTRAREVPASSYCPAPSTMGTLGCPSPNSQEEGSDVCAEVTTC